VQSLKGSSVTEEVKATLYTYHGFRRPNAVLKAWRDSETGKVTIYFTQAVTAVNADYIELDAPNERKLEAADL
jgi:hypothetical protein